MIAVAAYLEAYNSSYIDPVLSGVIYIQIDPGIPGGYRLTNDPAIKDAITRDMAVIELAQFAQLLSRFIDVLLVGNVHDINNYISNDIRQFVGSLNFKNISTIMQSRITITGSLTTCNLSSDIASRTTYGTLNNINAEALVLYHTSDTSFPVVLNYCVNNQTAAVYSSTLLESLLMFSGVETLSLTYATQTQDVGGSSNTSNNGTTLVAVNELYLIFPHIAMTSDLPFYYILAVIAQSHNVSLPDEQGPTLEEILKMIQSGDEILALRALEQARELLDEGKITETQYRNLLEVYKVLYGEVPAEFDLNNNNVDDVVIDLDRILSQIHDTKESFSVSSENTTANTKTNIFDKLLNLTSYIIISLSLASAAMYGSLLYKRRELNEVLFLPRILLGKPPYENLADNVKWCYHAFIYVLSLRGLPKYEWETPREYLQRVEGILSDEYKVLLEDLTREYELLKYGEIPDPGLTEYVVEDCIREIRRALFTWHLKRDG